MFKGFDFIESSYEVISPKTGLSYIIRPLKSGEEISLKNSVFTKRSSMVSVLNDLTFSVLKILPKEIKNKEDFFNKVPDSDKELILYALYIVTYDNIIEVPITCPVCGKEYKEKLDLKALYHVEKTNKKMSPEKWFSVEYIIEDPELMPGGRIILSDISIKQVTEYLDIVSNTEMEDQVDVYLPYIKRLEAINSKGEVEDSTDDKVEILTYYPKFPLKIKNQIKEIVKKEFRPYEPEFYVDWECDDKSCGHKERLYRNIPDEFFRMALGLEI